MRRQIKILRNAAKCKACGQVIESKNVHDFVTCSCFDNVENTSGIFIDGGLKYLRRGGNMNNLIELSETRPYTDKEQKEYEERCERQLKMLYGEVNNARL